MPPKRSISLTMLPASQDPQELGCVDQRKQKRTLQELTLKPAGFPLHLDGDREPVTLTCENPELFEAYAHEQWAGLYVASGDFLFDRCMFPDFAFKIIDSKPVKGRIGLKTRITLDGSPLIPTHQEHPNIHFSDVIGQEAAKRKCRIIMEYLKGPTRFGDWSPRNILFYGAPGTGKTLMAKALAGEAGVPIFLIKATELLGMHVGEGAARIHKLYRVASSVAPAIVFIDEIDAVGLDRKYQAIRGDVTEVVNALISELDGLTSNAGVVTITATNAMGLLDAAVDSRFEERIEFTLPTDDERRAMLMMWFKTFPIPFKADLNLIVKVTRNMSGRDLKERIAKNLLHNGILDGKDSIDDTQVLALLSSLTNSMEHPDRKTGSLS